MVGSPQNRRKPTPPKPAYTTLEMGEPSTLKSVGKAPAKERPRFRDERDFASPDVVRGVVQAMEERQGELVSGLVSLQEEVRESVGTIVDAVNAGRKVHQSVEVPAEPFDLDANIPLVESDAEEDDDTARDHTHGRSRDRSASQFPKPTTRIVGTITPLDDGQEPRYAYWKISLQDRLQINGDHYPNEATRMALIWSITVGQAHSYLYPRYKSGVAGEYKTASEMIETLDEFFITGFEEEDYRREFDKMGIGRGTHYQTGKPISPNETFLEFAGRFKSLAVLGSVPNSEWFHQM